MLGPTAPPPAIAQPAWNGEPGWLVIGESIRVEGAGERGARKAGERIAKGIGASPVRSDLFAGLHREPCDAKTTNLHIEFVADARLLRRVTATAVRPPLAAHQRRFAPMPQLETGGGSTLGFGGGSAALGIQSSSSRPVPGSSSP